MKTFLLIFIIGLFGCSKGPNYNPASFRGTWIEVINRKDTIYFDPVWNNEDRNGFKLRRGKEMRNGYLLPKIGAGIYTYTIAGDKISLHYIYSSSSYPIIYNVTWTRKKIMIGNFYDPNFKGVIETFEKLN